MKICEVLNEKMELFDKILELSIQQSDMLEKEDIHKLDAATDEKQILIDQLEEIDRISGNVVGDAKNFTVESKELKQRLRAVVGKVLALDKKNSETTRFMIEQQALEIKKINNDRRKMHLYSSNFRTSDGIYIDKKK